MKGRGTSGVRSPQHQTRRGTPGRVGRRPEDWGHSNQEQGLPQEAPGEAGTPDTGAPRWTNTRQEHRPCRPGQGPGRRPKTQDHNRRHLRRGLVVKALTGMAGVEGGGHPSTNGDQCPEEGPTRFHQEGCGQCRRRNWHQGRYTPARRVPGEAPSCGRPKDGRPSGTAPAQLEEENGIEDPTPPAHLKVWNPGSEVQRSWARPGLRRRRRNGEIGARQHSTPSSRANKQEQGDGPTRDPATTGDQSRRDRPRPRHRVEE